MTEPADDIPPELRELIRAAGSPTPPPGLQESMLSALSKEMLTALPATGALSAALGKWGLVTTVAALVTGAVAGVAVDRYALPAPVQLHVNEQPLPQPPPEVRREEPRKPPAPQPAASAPQAPPSTLPKRTPKAAPVDDHLAEEQQLVEMARTAVLRGEPDLATTPLAEHERRFPTGQLSEERDALWVQVAAQTGDRQAATERAERFRRKHPKSVLLPVVDHVAPPTP